MLYCKERMRSRQGSMSCAADRNAYYHPCFIRGKRELCRHIFRAKIKGAGPRKANRPDEEPDFYGPGFADPVAPARAEAVAPDRAASSASAADPAMRRFPQAVGRHALHPLLQLPPTIDAGIVSRQVSGSSSGSSSALFDGFDGSIAVRPAGPLLLGALWPQHSHLATAPAPAAAALPLLVGMPRLPALAAAAVIRNPGAGWLSYTPFLQPQHQQPRHSFPARKHRLPPALQVPAPLPLPLPQPQPRFAAVEGASSALPRPRPPPGPLPPAPASLPPPASQLTRRSLPAISARDRSDSSSEN
jgi:hypothetical protein